MTISQEIIEEIISSLSFNEQGLIPVIAQSVDTDEVLMLAWMNADAIRKTLQTNRVTYFSRSRKKLWQKGETSGNIQELVAFRFDCDKDTILVRVKQTGAACHTNRPNCFYYEVKDNEITIISEPIN